MKYDYEFDDRKGRKIGFDVTSGSIRAYSGGTPVGEFTLNITDFDDMFPPVVHADAIDVDEEFRNAGIASEMVRLAFEQHGKIVPPPTYEPQREKRNTITEDGMRLIRSGQKKGWFAEFPDREPPDCEQDD